MPGGYHAASTVRLGTGPPPPIVGGSMFARPVRFLALAVVLGLALPAAAAPCYLILDSKDVVLYRDLVPPFDLSVQQSPERAALRQRGQILLIAEFENCRPVGYVSTVTGGTSASVDEIVMQLKPAISTSVGTPQNPGVVTGFR
jgi:hypothetical protein